jgi:thymidylate synthase (FAD)
MEAAGIAKEQCRVVLPLCLETQFIWTGSLAAFMHLWRLRLKPDAQQETREVAAMMLDLVKNLPSDPFKFTLEAFGL